MDVGSLTALLEDWRTRGDVACAALGVSAPGHPDIVAVAGAVDADEPLRPDHRFLLTSVTKAVTATQVALLLDRGVIDLWEPAATYVPELVDREQIRVWHLLAHCSGLSLGANVAEGPPTDRPEKVLRRLALEAPLANRPGDVVTYCSPAFWVLAALIERVTGDDHAEHLRRRVLEPLSLSATSYEPGRDPPVGYVPARASRNAHLAEQVRRLRYPAGGLVGTAGDLLGFGSAVAASADGGHEALLSPATLGAVARVWSRGTWPDGRPAAWGLGWELAVPGDGWSPRTLFHAGVSGTGLWIDLDRRVVLALLTATWYPPRRCYAELANAVTAAVSRAAPPDPPRTPKAEER